MGPKRRSRAEWRELVQEYRASGQNREAFARKRGLNVSTLSWWTSEFRQETSSALAPTFVAVEVLGRSESRAEGPTDRVIGVVERGPVRFVVGAEADPRWLAALLAELGRC